MALIDKHGKRRQISFRIGELADQRLKEHAGLFNMEPSEYAKAVLYRELGVFTEPLDQRRKAWKRKQPPTKDVDDWQEEKDVEPEVEAGRGSTSS